MNFSNKITNNAYVLHRWIDIDCFNFSLNIDRYADLIPAGSLLYILTPLKNIGFWPYLVLNWRMLNAYVLWYRVPCVLTFRRLPWVCLRL